ncbi:hypothetical protein GCM10027034_04150 [Ramlibacter solisilvae]|uniref:O-antigen ligase-related domain-containing protein n=2 Tax=Ramlibacter tataouinensis TaxID=94132 RepID=A0A127JYX1_9BURK|nr:hypothetical protein UC35_22740 [Ramlibacter tataouinensis]
MALAAPSRALMTARGLLMAMAVALMYSPPVVVALQVALLVTFLASSELRARFAAVCRQPMVIGMFAFYLMLVVAATYSIAPLPDAARMLNGWRKLLLLPAAAAVFDDPGAKLRIALLLVMATVIGALLSYGSLLSGIPLQSSDPIPGIVARNHATQGMLFAVGAFVAAALAQFGPFERRGRVLLTAAAVLLTTNVAFTTHGRSGYLVLMACALALAVFALRRPSARTRWVAVVMLAAVVAVLLGAPKAQQRVHQAVTEINTYSQLPDRTEVGIRVHFWKNTLEMIGQRPLLGVGTDGFLTAYRHQVADKTGVAATETSDPHNQFLKIAAEQGLIGLAVFLAFLLATAVLQRPDPVYRLLGLGVLFAWCASSMATSHFSTFAEGTFIYLWLGAMLSDPGSVRRRKT